MKGKDERYSDPRGCQRVNLTFPLHQIKSVYLACNPACINVLSSVRISIIVVWSEPFTLKHQYTHSSYCSLCISQGADLRKSNMARKLTRFSDMQACLSYPWGAPSITYCLCFLQAYCLPRVHANIWCNLNASRGPGSGVKYNSTPPPQREHYGSEHND